MQHEPIRVFDWQDLAEQLLLALGDQVEQRGSPAWVRVFQDRTSDAGFSVDAADGAAELIGWTAPPTCLAVGTVATGTLHPADPEAWSDGDAGRWAATRHLGARVRMCCVVGRDGGVGWTLEAPGAVPYRSAPEQGRVLDCLKRCLGLPTLPADAPVGELHAAAWVGSLLEAAMRSTEPLTWADVNRLHPLARLLSGELGPVAGDRAADDRGSDGFRDLIRAAANAWSWEEIRRRAADGDLPGLVDAPTAAWMDDGMFSRWVLASVPPPRQLLAAVQPYLVPTAARRLTDALDGFC